MSALGPTMLTHCNPITEEGGILNLLHFTYDLLIVFEIAPTQVGFEFGKQEIRWS